MSSIIAWIKVIICMREPHSMITGRNELAACHGNSTNNRKSSWWIEKASHKDTFTEWHPIIATLENAKRGVLTAWEWSGLRLDGIGKRWGWWTEICGCQSTSICGCVTVSWSCQLPLEAVYNVYLRKLKNMRIVCVWRTGQPIFSKDKPLH